MTGPIVEITGPTGTTGTTGGVWYDPSNQLFYYSDTKTFVIQHPIDENKYLVHGCLEGPEAGVYYRGKGEIVNNHLTTIELPNYVDRLARNFTVHLTPIYNHNNGNIIPSYAYGELEDCKFNVYGANGKFSWIVYGLRSNINTEPLKMDTKLHGHGPYQWCE